MTIVSRTELTQALPLRYWTPEAWAISVLEQPLALLNDHAHLERKAALNALDMLNRWPVSPPPPSWVSSMMAIAKDEIDHMIQVNRLLEKRGSRLTKSHKNPYASDLNACVRKGQGREDLLDSLLVSALIEARSCERFFVLGNAVQDQELRDLYQGLWASERGHFKQFLDAAQEVIPAVEVASRWAWFLDQEAKIIEKQKPSAQIHSGYLTMVEGVS